MEAIVFLSGSSVVLYSWIGGRKACAFQTIFKRTDEFFDYVGAVSDVCSDNHEVAVFTALIEEAQRRNLRHRDASDEQDQHDLALGLSRCRRDRS